MKLKAYQELEMLALAELEMQERARRKLLPFILYTKEDYYVEWYHKVMCKYLDAWVEGKIKRLMIFMPPRHGKSEAVSRRLPAYIFGRNPDARIIGAAYSSSLANANTLDIQRIMDSPAYLELFPDSRLPTPGYNKEEGKWIRNSSEFEILFRRGGYLSKGVGGGITGRGADYFIIDDPIKNAQEADSVNIREIHWDWYTSTAYTRLEREGRMLVTMTRWHEDDLAGRLLTQMRQDPSADQWVVLSFPAILDTLDGKHPDDIRKLGESLWPWKYSAERLQSMKASAGSRVWNALFQQRPSALAGNIFKRQWLSKTWREKPGRFDEIIQSWDCTFEDTNTSDFVVGQVWGKIGAEFYLLDQVRDRMSYTETKAAIRAMSAKWPTAWRKVVERKANGHAILNEMKREILGLVGYEPKESKVSRARSVEPLFEAGNVILPHPSVASWVQDYIEELIGFPNGVNDDQVDASVQALIHLREDGDWLAGLTA